MYSLNSEKENQIKTDCVGQGKGINIRGWELPAPREHEIKLSISEICSMFCRSNRDIYLKYISKVEAIPSKAMIIGGMCHTIIANIFKKAKDFQDDKIKYENLLDYSFKLRDDRDLIEEIIWDGNQLENLKKLCNKTNLDYEIELEDMITWLQTIVNYEIIRIENNWSRILDKSFRINLVEGWADGSILETRWGKVDFIGSIDNEMIIFDLKTGSSYKDNLGYKLQITAYALALEKTLKKPLNIGCLVFPLRKEDKSPLDEPIIDYFLINNELRKGFFNQRDKMFKVLDEEQLPKIVDSFPCKWCGYNYFCNESGGNL